jgi:hypothetical protein
MYISGTCLWKENLPVSAVIDRLSTARVVLPLPALNVANKRLFAVLIAGRLQRDTPVSNVGFQDLTNSPDSLKN